MRGKARSAFAVLMVLPLTAGYLLITKEPASVPPELGAPLPSTRVELTLGGASFRLDSVLLERRAECTYLTVVSPTCPVCAAMRESWTRKHQDWQRQSNATAQLIWITTSTLVEGQRFVAGTRAQHIPLMAFSDVSHSARKLALRGTPTSFLLAADGRLQKIVLGDVFPNDSVVRRSCRSS